VLDFLLESAYACAPGCAGSRHLNSTDMSEPKFLTMAELEAGLDWIRNSPRTEGQVKLLVRRPSKETREVLTQARLDLAEGLMGDDWKSRGSKSMPDGSANPEMQLNVMNSRVIALLAPDETRWPLAGDQLYLDLDLSMVAAPVGTKLAIGSAVLEITGPPHLGCSKFQARFGLDALKFVNSPVGRELRLRGLNARIVRPGIVCVGDIVTKL